MKNKKILSVVLAVALVASLAVGMTVAYLQDTDSDVNVMTMGNVYIKQNEQERVDTNELADAANNLKDFSQAKPLLPAVYPGTSIPWDANNGVNDAWKAVEANDNVVDKFVTVTNTGASAAYVRTVIAYEGDVINGQDIHVVHNDINSSNPEVGGAFAATDYIENVVIGGVRYDLIVYTYKVALQPGETTIPSLKQVYMDKTCGNEECAKYGETYDILVVSQAIQADGFADAVTALNEGFGEITATTNPWVNGGTYETTYISNQEELVEALANGATNLILEDGSYTIPGNIGSTTRAANPGRTVAITGLSKNVVFEIASVGVNGANISFNNVTLNYSNATYTGVQHAGEMSYNDCVINNGHCLYGSSETYNNCQINLNSNYLWTYGAGEVTFKGCTFNTDGKALLVYTETATQIQSVNITNCTFNATKTAQTGAGDDCAAVEIDSSLVKKGSYTVNFEGVNVVDSDFAGLYRIKKGAELGNVTVNGARYGVNTVPALLKALQNGADVVFVGDLGIEPAEGSNGYGATGASQKNGGVIDGNGYTLDVSGANGTWDSGINTTGGTIKNITITGAFRGIFINKNSSHTERVILDNVTITPGAYTISCDSAANQGLTATNCTFNGWTSFAKTLGDAEFINCHFDTNGSYKYMRPYAPTVLEGCTFCAGYALDATRTTVTLKNCYVGDTLITADNVVSLLGEDAAKVVVSNG